MQKQITILLKPLKGQFPLAYANLKQKCQEAGYKSVGDAWTARNLSSPIFLEFFKENRSEVTLEKFNQSNLEKVIEALHPAFLYCQARLNAKQMKTVSVNRSTPVIVTGQWAEVLDNFHFKTAHDYLAGPRKISGFYQNNRDLVDPNWLAQRRAS